MPPQTTKEEDLKIVKRYFAAGFLGLPWLWFVMVLNYYKKIKYQPEIKNYIYGAMLGFVIYTSVFIGWVVHFQSNWKMEEGLQGLLMVFVPSNPW